jgi:hypothetical protein
MPSVNRSWISSFLTSSVALVCQGMGLILDWYFLGKYQRVIYREARQNLQREEGRNRADQWQTLQRNVKKLSNTFFFFASEKIKLPFPNVLLTCYTFYHWYFLVNPCLIRWKVVRMWRVNSGIQLCLVWFNLVMMCRVNSEYLYWTVCIEIWCDGCFQEVFSWAQKWQGWDGWVFIECG